MRPERLRLADIVEAADTISGYAADLTREEFLADARTRGAAVYELIIIGEAAIHISDNLRKRHPEIPWSDIVGLRNIAVHAYHTMDWGILWTTVKQNVPKLRRQIAAILEAEFPGDA